MNKRILAISLLITFLSSSLSFSQNADDVIPFQGQLANQNGQPLTSTVPVNIIFRLYQAPVGGVAIWEEVQPNVTVNAGRFSVLLGSHDALPANSYFNSTLYLGITVDDGDPQTTDVEMRPRQALVPVISASYARDADKLRGHDWSILFGPGDPATNSLLNSKIADGSIQAAKIERGSIHKGLIMSNTITAGQIAASTITPNEISPASLTLSSLAKEVIDHLVPAGTIIAFAGETNNLPDGWLICNGRAVSSTQFPNLFSRIGRNWGSGVPNSSNNFNLPDLRGMFLRGVNHGRDDGYEDTAARFRTNAVPKGGTNTGGLVTGNSGSEVGSVQASTLPKHIHRWAFSNSGDAFTRQLRSWNTNGTETVVLSDFGQKQIVDQSNVQEDNFKEVTPGNNALNLFTDRLSGSAITDGQVAPPNAFVNYLIKY